MNGIKGIIHRESKNVKKKVTEWISKYQYSEKEFNEWIAEHRYFDESKEIYEWINKYQYPDDGSVDDESIDDESNDDESDNDEKTEKPAYQQFISFDFKR